MNERDYHFKLIKEGDSDPLMTGDAGSIAVIFHNLTGRNFENRPRQDLQKYLVYMEKQLGTKLTGQLQVINPEGKLLREGVIATV